MFTKLTDKRSIAKKIISGILWSPVIVIVLFCLVFAAHEIINSFLIKGPIDFIVSLMKVAGIEALILGYIIALVWSNQK